MSLNVTILGCGSSAGVPLIGCDCAVCVSDNPKNKRSRVSVLLEQGDTKLLVDTSPDLKQQALRHHITTVDAIIYTHAHADHCHGIDDVRSFNFHKNQTIKCYSDHATIAEIKQRFDYVFRPPIPEYGWFKASLEPIECSLDSHDPITIGDMDIILFRQEHGTHSTVGIKTGHTVYSTDVNNFPKESHYLLENLDLWVVDCLRYNPAPTHAHLELTLSWIKEFKPKRAILTHMSHALDYDTLMKETPAHVEPAYDGMVIHL